ncbi:hypothetical protein [Deinococcus ruber]|uniref:Uncharacterized protein n=1 Tax=Deinococcus ruber TaxID=1848197 RepID=A0A918F4G2_9DEIO|nr:hypothetical protein [Deinococcus ruber]GGR00069.1 hypothetical protein GCM10008957_10950 [Deinococcus ruber]
MKIKVRIAGGLAEVQIKVHERLRVTPQQLAGLAETAEISLVEAMKALKETALAVKHMEYIAQLKADALNQRMNLAARIRAAAKHEELTGESIFIAEANSTHFLKRSRQNAGSGVQNGADLSPIYKHGLNTDSLPIDQHDDICGNPDVFVGAVQGITEKFSVAVPTGDIPAEVFGTAENAIENEADTGVAVGRFTHD